MNLEKDKTIKKESLFCQYSSKDRKIRNVFITELFNNSNFYEFGNLLFSQTFILFLIMSNSTLNQNAEIQPENNYYDQVEVQISDGIVHSSFRKSTTFQDLLHFKKR